MAAIVQPTDKAGELYIPALGRKVQLIEWREDDFYDSVYQASGAITAGTSLELFRDLTNKNLQHTNLRTARNIPSGSEFVMNRIGVLIAQAFSNTVPIVGDLLKAAYAGTLTFKINDRLVSEGPLFKYQSGYGMTGSTTANSTSLVTTGVPSLAAAPNLLVAQPIKDNDDLQSTIDFKGDAWITGSQVGTTLTGALVFMNMLHGLIKKPQGR